MPTVALQTVSARATPSDLPFGLNRSGTQ